MNLKTELESKLIEIKCNSSISLRDSYFRLIKKSSLIDKVLIYKIEFVNSKLKTLNNPNGVNLSRGKLNQSSNHWVHMSPQ